MVLVERSCCSFKWEAEGARAHLYERERATEDGRKVVTGKQKEKHWRLYFHDIVRRNYNLFGCLFMRQLRFVCLSKNRGLNMVQLLKMELILSPHKANTVPLAFATTRTCTLRSESTAHAHFTLRLADDSKDGGLQSSACLYSEDVCHKNKP